MDIGTLPSVPQSGATEGTKLGPQIGQNRTLVPTRKTGTPSLVPQSKNCNKIARTKEEEDVEKGSRAGAIYTSAPSSAPRPYPTVLGDLDLEDDPRVAEAIYSVIVDTKETV